jgi:hypothetical protein
VKWVGLDGAWLAQHLARWTSSRLFWRMPTLSPAGLVKRFAEHLDAGADGLLRVSNTDDFDLFADLDNSALDTARSQTVPRPDGNQTSSRASGRRRPLHAGMGML